MLKYERIGNGPTVVFIHGFLGSSEIYSKAKKRLASQYDAIFIDFAGHGASQNENVEPTVYDYAEQIAEVLRHEQVKSSTWVGHSMGGYIVLAALEKQIAKIDKAVLAYSAVSADDAKAKEKRDAAIETIEQQGKEAFISSVIGNFFSNNATPQTVEGGRQIALQATNEGLKTALLTMKNRPSQQTLIDAVPIPVLVIEGTEDKVVSPIETSNPNVHKVTTTTGHLGMLENPDAFMKHLTLFI